MSTYTHYYCFTVTRRNHKCAGDLKQAAAVVAAAASSAAATAAVVHHASIDPIVDPRSVFVIMITSLQSSLFYIVGT